MNEVHDLKALYDIAGPALLFALFVSITMQILRALVEKVGVPVAQRYNLLKSEFARSILRDVWNNLAMPLLLPCAFGGILAVYLVMMSYPPGVDTTAERAMFGVAVGAFSSVVYRAVRAMLHSYAASKGVTDLWMPSAGWFGWF